MVNLKHDFYSMIDKWLGKMIDTEHRDWPNFYMHDELAQQMTEAAWQVFESAVKSSQYTENESK